VPARFFSHSLAIAAAGLGIINSMNTQSQYEAEGPPEYIDVAEAARIAGVSKRTIHNRIKRGGYESHLQSVQSGRSHTMKRFISRESVLQGLGNERENKALSKVGKDNESALQVLQQFQAAAEGLQGFQDTAARLAEAIEKQNELAEKQSRRKLWGLLITSGVCAAMLGAALWYGVRVLQAAGINL